MKDAFREKLSEIRSTARRESPRLAAVAPRSLDELSGVTRTGGVLVVERSAAEFAPGTPGPLLAGLARAGLGVRDRDDVDGEIRALVEHPERALFIDTETTGLAGNMVFLLGAMRVSGEGIVLTQVLARDYREEPALLEVWRDMATRAEFLVSFNGKAFDVPILRDRLGLHHLEAPPARLHVDLLHHARRRWRTVLPDCRLQTIEWQLCGRRRVGDIPGEEIPAAYHHFVRTGDTRDMLTVLHHNAMDLLTLADIVLALSSGGGAKRLTGEAP